MSQDTNNSKSTGTLDPAAAEPSGSHRRLESDFFVELVRDASDDTTRRMGFYIADACTSELQLLCSSELELVKSAYGFTNGNTNSPIMASMQRRVHMCLATHKIELGSRCWDVFTDQIVKSQQTQASPTHTPTPQPTGYNITYLSREDRRKDSTSFRQWEGDVETKTYPGPQGGTIQVFINNGGRDTDRSGCREPESQLLERLIVLPFFLVGVVVCVKYVIKRLRGSSSPFVMPRAEYSPLQATDPAT